MESGGVLYFDCGDMTNMYVLAEILRNVDSVEFGGSCHRLIIL